MKRDVPVACSSVRRCVASVLCTYPGWQSILLLFCFPVARAVAALRCCLARRLCRLVRELVLVSARVGRALPRWLCLRRVVVAAAVGVCWGCASPSVRARVGDSSGVGCALAMVLLGGLLGLVLC